MSTEDLLSHVPERLRPQLKTLVRPCVRAVPGGEGRSRIGGAPDLPPDFEWPGDLVFVAQFDLAEAAPFDKDHQLPPSGLLSFFYDTRNQPWGFDPKDAGGWAVHHFKDVNSLKRVPPKELPETPVRLETGWCLPAFDAIEMEGIEMTDPELDAYIDAETGGHRLLGWSEHIQGDMRLQCQLVSNGIYCGDAKGYQDPRVPELQKGVMEWVLLFQLDSDEDAGLMFGDLGRVYFWIRQSDLAAARFDRVWTILQCT